MTTYPSNNNPADAALAEPPRAGKALLRIRSKTAETTLDPADTQDPSIQSEPTRREKQPKPPPNRSPRLIFVNRYFYPDISATSQLLTDLAVFLANDGYEVHIVTSRQLYENPHANLAPTETHQGVRIYRVATSRFGRQRLGGESHDSEKQTIFTDYAPGTKLLRVVGWKIDASSPVSTIYYLLLWVGPAF